MFKKLLRELKRRWLHLQLDLAKEELSISYKSGNPHYIRDCREKIRQRDLDLLRHLLGK